MPTSVKSKHLYTLILLILTSLSFNAHAAQSGNGNVATLHSAYGGWLFRIDSANNNPESCTKDQFLLQGNHSQYEQIFSFLLAAHVAAKPVVVFTNGCDANGYNIVAGIYSNWNI